MRAAALLAWLLATPVLAGVDEAATGHILPAFARFAEETAVLADSARTDCTAAALRPAFHDAFDAWMGISHLQFGPLEAEGRNLAIAFWPDPRGMVPQTLAGLIAAQDPAVESEAAFAEVSVAGRGLFALETLLYDSGLSDYARGDYACRLAVALSADLARMGQDLNADWQGYAEILKGAGEDGNATYLTPRESVQELFTALMTGLEFTQDQRIGRPMGSFERPRPTRAEARRSGRSLRNVVLSLEALRGLARTLSDRPIPRTEAAFAAALETAAGLDDPVFAAVADPAGRLRLEILQQRIAAIRQAASNEIGATSGVAAGFNSSDGD